MAKRKVKGQVILNTEVEAYAEPQKQKIASVGKANFKEVEYKSLAEKIAKDRLFYRNYYYPGGREIFPNTLKLQSVDKFFPYAEGGPLFVDELTKYDNAQTYKEKTAKMQALGHRYIAIEHDAKELDVIERMAL